GLGLCCWFVFLLTFAPESGNTDRHRGANRLPAKRKTDAETSAPTRYGKAKTACFQQNPAKVSEIRNVNAGTAEFGICRESRWVAPGAAL
ncbi:MAG: hypothetical protein ABIT37_07580, partial [Luteolibacter sp.]